MKGSIRRRSKGSWEITIDMGRDEHGKRQRKFINVKGKKAYAERQLRELLASLDKGIPIDTSRLTVAELLDQWYASYVVPKLGPRTIESYEVIIRLHLKPNLGHHELTKLEPIHIQNMESSLLTKGKAAKTVQNVHRVLNEALGHAIKWGLLWKNPMSVVDAPKPRKYEANVPSSPNVLNILKRAKETPYHVAFHFIAYTGCRRGECLGVRWQDVDLEQGVVSIVQNVQRVKGMGLVIEPPKSQKGRRAIAIDEATVALLKNHRITRLEHRLQVGEKWEDHDLVFAGPIGRPLDPSVLTHRFKKLAKKADVPSIRLHDLRHFHASVLLRQGVHPKVVQERLGHATISITLDTYSHVIPSLQAEAADTFAGVMSREAEIR